MIDRSCQLCKSNETNLLTKENNWNIVQCKNCGFVYVNPGPTEEFLKEHYQNYLPCNQKEIDRWQYMMSNVFRKSLSIIKKYSKFKQNKLLDIGCGHGFFLQEIKKQGCDGYGIDLSEKAVDYAKKNDLNVTNSTLFDSKFKDAEFDIVTMFYVLEHIINPADYLKEVKRILKPNGLLLIRVPDTTPIVKLLKVFNISNKLYDAPSHLSDFSPRTIRAMLKKVGFMDIKTFIGGKTYPSSLRQRLISCFFGGLASFIEKLTFGKYLLPGVSKTTIAFKR